MATLMIFSRSPSSFARRTRSTVPMTAITAPIPWEMALSTSSPMLWRRRSRRIQPRILSWSVPPLLIFKSVYLVFYIKNTTEPFKSQHYIIIHTELSCSLYKQCPIFIKTFSPQRFLPTSALEHGAPPLDAPLPLQESPIVFLPDAIPKSRSFFTTPPKERIPLDFLGGAFYTQHKENIILL